MLAGLVNATHDGLLQLPEKLLAKRHVGGTIHCKWEFHHAAHYPISIF